MSDPAHILVVEDNSALRGQIVQILELEGYRVTEACNGREGLAAALKSQPGLIICDVSMPDIDGYEMLRQLRESEPGSPIPFIFLSARVARNDVRAGMELGADDYLTKPFEIAELLRAVETRLRRHAQAEARAERVVVNEHAKMLLMLPNELRTPLHGIMGAAEILKLDLEASGNLAGEPAAMLELIQNSSIRLEQFATNLVLHLQLELATKTGAHSAAFKDPGPSPLAECIRTSADAEAARHQRTQDLQISPATDVHAAIGNEFLKKILRELIQNAFKFSEPGTPVEISWRQAGTHAEVLIEDRGIGITQEEAANMRPFQQWRRAEFEQQGLGLGFAIARTLATLNGGTVAIAPRSNAGCGTSVLFTVPIAVPPTP